MLFLKSPISLRVHWVIHVFPLLWGVKECRLQSLQTVQPVLRPPSIQAVHSYSLTHPPSTLALVSAKSTCNPTSSNKHLHLLNTNTCQDANDQVLLFRHGSQRRADPASPARRQLWLWGSPDRLPRLAGGAQGWHHFWADTCAPLGRGGARAVNGHCQVDGFILYHWLHDFSWLFVCVGYRLWYFGKFVMLHQIKNWKILTIWSDSRAGLWQEGLALRARLTWSLRRPTWSDHV